MKSVLTRIALISFLIILLIPNLTSAEMKTFIKEYTYQASEDDSRNSSRVTAMREVKRLLLEELGTYLESITEVKNFQITKDQLTSLTAGIVKTEIIDDKWDGRTYWIKTKIAADANDVIKSVDKLRKDREKSRELEETKKRADAILDDNKKLREELALAKGSAKEKVKQKYDNSIKELSAIEWYESGTANRIKGNLETAIQDFSQAITFNSNYVEAYNDRGITYGQLGRYGDAFRDFNKSIELNPYNAETYNNRGIVYTEFKKYNDAISDYNKSIGLNPNNASSYCGRGDVYAILGKHDDAISDYSKSIELNPNYAIVYYNRGTSYANIGKHNDAISDYNVAIELNPKNTAAYYNRGAAYSRLDKYSDAIYNYSKAVELNPRDAEAYSRRGITYAIIGNMKNALNDFSHTIKLQPNEANGYYYRAMIYSQIKQNTDAIKDLKKAIRINPELKNDATTNIAFNNIKNAPEFKKLIGK